MFKKNEYLKTVRRPYPPFFTTLIMEGCSDYNHYYEFTNQKYAMRNVIISDEIFFYGKKEFNSGVKIIFRRWIDPIIFNKAQKLFFQREKELIKSTKLNLEEFGNAYKIYMPALMLPWFIEKPVDDNLRKALEAKTSDKEVDQLIDKLNISLRDNFYKHEEYDLITTSNLISHVKKYEWINSRYGEEYPYTIDQAQKKLKKINKEKFLQKWDKEKNSLKQTINKTKQILGDSHTHLVDLMQFIIFYRTQRTDIMNKAGYLFIPKLKQISKKMGITYKQLLFCTFQEVLTSQIPALKEIDQRIKNNAVVMENGKISCASGKKSDKIREFFKENLKEINEFKGIIAQKGLVTGPVKLVFSRDDYDKVNDGDILVASMTTPEMISTMKKAVAFITDEGGITCHAAIISREMKKPCIIGTKIATKVLKDGDLVDVDANKGIIKILKRRR
ncbi:hypothetical protein KKG58_01010 [Patescibacteria group bacterium]|nr:hypothetical protein [Patescibacteria group bacterium]